VPSGVVQEAYAGVKGWLVPRHARGRRNRRRADKALLAGGLSRYRGGTTCFKRWLGGVKREGV
jgi:hypothetical protein